MENIKFYQINLHKSNAAQTSFLNEIKAKDKNIICLIQEPHFYSRTGSTPIPTSIPRKEMQVLHGTGAHDNWPRAMIVASKNLKISLLETLSPRDTTCVKLHSLKEELIICSSYQDITIAEAVNNITKCVDLAKSNNETIIVGADTNAHSQLWMSQTSNSRGEKFEDFITANELNVCNIGSKPTYDCKTGKSIIDVTITTNDIHDKIKNWTVLYIRGVH